MGPELGAFLSFISVLLMSLVGLTYRQEGRLSRIEGDVKSLFNGALTDIKERVEKTESNIAQLPCHKVRPHANEIARDGGQLTG